VATLLMRAGRMADEVRAESERVDLARLLLTLLFLVPFVLGWLAAMAWTAATWLWAAGLVGYRTARRRDDGRTGDVA